MTRARCEKCGASQPPDWQAGDLCQACGAPVRRDVRCFWCAKWTPQGKFCRHCGAEVVDDPLYGAARMIKDAGTDRFTVPKLLRELEPDQLDNFTRIYQRQAVAVARHVDELRFLERFLFHRGFSAELEETLIPQLPWPDATLAAHSAPPPPPGDDDLATVTAIGVTTPFAQTRALAGLARLRLDDWAAFEDAVATFRSAEGDVKAEAALVLTGWRVRTARWDRRLDRDALAAELERSPFRLEAAVRLALLGTVNPDLLKEAQASADPETAFAAALALGDVDRLQTALRGDPLEQIAAGNALIALGVIAPVVEPLRKSPAEVQRELVESALDRDEPLPELGDTLLAIVETTDDDTLRERAARILCRQARPEWALRIARAARGERYIFQSLLSERAALPPETLAEVAAYLIDAGFFTMNQYGIEDAATRGAIPDSFVPAQFDRAGAEIRIELLRFAEKQLEARGDEALHRFVMNVVFGPHPAARRAAAWWVLHRWYRRDDVRGEGPLKLAREPIERFFGSPARFIPMLAQVLRDDATLKEVGVYEMLANLFSSLEPEAVPVFFAEEEATHDLLQATLAALRGDYWPYFHDAMLKFVALVGVHPRWRDEAIAGIEALASPGSYYWDKALEALRPAAGP